MSDGAEQLHSSASPELSHPTDSPLRATHEELNQTSFWSGERSRPQFGIQVPIALAVLASVGTALYLRWRTRSRLSRLLRILMIVRVVRSSVPAARITAPLGAAGALALPAAILIARARQARKRSHLDLLSERLAALEASAQLRSEKPRRRDLALGLVVGAALTVLWSRLRRVTPAE